MDTSSIGSITLACLLGLAIVTIWLQSQPKNPDFIPNLINSLRPIGSYFTTWFTLLPYVVFLAGPVIDIMSSQYMYTKASVVGFLTLVIVYIFGSDGVARTMSNVVPAIKTVAADGTSAWNWKGVGIIAAVVIVAGSLIGIPIGVGNQLSRQIAPTIGAFILLCLLAGSNLLGDVTPVQRILSGDTSTSYAGVTIADVCATPGLGCVQTVFAPTGILLNTSIMSCHLVESLDTHNYKNAGLIAGIMGGTYLIEVATQLTKGCTSAYKYGGWSLLIALLIGMGSGTTAYYAMKSIGQESFTQQSEESGVFHPPPAPEKAKKSSDLSKKIVVGAATDVSEPVDENQDAFVCEAYKDGELVTSTLVE